MLLELREPLKKEKDKPEKEKDLNNRRDKEFRLTLNRLDKNNSLRNHQLLLSRLESKEKTTWTRSRNKSKLKCRKEKLKRRRDRL
jgi:hypothetical protein